ncbi:TonB-dependent receptor [Duganella sacchari]|uniref:TonB-dependent receptor n=1 Tax=Duganella sacchari TaxID=551987 RepID=A0A1M7R5T5_9BURK|nr:TonB-dependent receptor [Duganella sacchari]SHN40900.1 TonB-dependent receptor [Duganella sacchari]
MKHKKMSWLIATLFTSPLLVQDALAQEAAGDIQQVNVTGIRASVRNALAAKEASNSIVEVVSSEDIGKLPDTTIAESLARLPGLSSGLDRGNASQIIARGMGPRFIGATLNGRELASSEPNRAVRFEQFPSESISGATVYKTQNAELAEGGIATTIDLQTVSPLKYNGRQISLKADALYYPLAKDIQGADKTAPRLGGVYIDQFANKTIGAAVAFSYQDQPSVQKNKRHWGFNDSGYDLNGDGKTEKAPWGFQDEARHGKDKRASVLGKLEWKPNSDVQITADTYYAEAKIKERGLQHWADGLGNWGGTNGAAYSNLDIRNGYLAGGTISNASLINNDFVYVQDTSVAATGLNGKFNAGDWKIDADLSTSHARRGSAWRDLRQYANGSVPVTWSFTGDEKQDYSFGIDSGNPANFGTPTLYVDTDGHVKDLLNAASVSASRPLDNSIFSRIKVGVRATDREKSYHQTTWTLAQKSPIPASAYETVNVSGYPAFIALKDFDGSIASAFGPDAFNPNGQVQEGWQIQNDQLAGWKVKERSSSAFVQGDLEGEALGKSYRGNVGVRLVHTTQTGYGMQSLNGAAPTAVSDGVSYTEILPSMNLIVNLDEAQQRQLRFSVARAMSRAPLDEMRSSRNLSVNNTDTSQPITGSAGNPQLKPMMANQVDLSYQWYFNKGSLLSAGAFYKKVTRYIAIESDTTTLNGRTATITRSVNGEGGDIRGLELVYQQAFTSLPAPFDGLGIASNYAYTTSNIHEQTPVGSPYPIEGLMKHNGGVTLWYEKAGYEARLSANYHSAFARNPTWGAGQLIMNEAETYVTLNLAKQLTSNIQLRFGIDNLTNQKAVYTSANIPVQQEVTEFGRRFNLGLSFKL